MTTPAVIKASFEGQFRRRFLRELWFPVAVTLAAMGSPLLQFGFASEALPFMGNGLVLGALFFGASALGIQRDLYYAKYSIVAGKMDALLENVDAHWTWCETTQTYAIHLTADPHGEDAEETEESSENSEDKTK